MERAVHPFVHLQGRWHDEHNHALQERSVSVSFGLRQDVPVQRDVRFIFRVFISDWKTERFVVICVSEQKGMSSLRRLTPDEVMEVMTCRRD